MTPLVTQNYLCVTAKRNLNDGRILDLIWAQ